MGTKAEKMTSLAAYKDGADSEQKAIYYIVGENENVLKNSPLLEAYKKNDIEVLILDDKEIDEIITPMYGAYQEWEFQDITTKIKDILGESVSDVRVTNRLSESPSCVVKDAGDAQMQQMAQMMRAMGQDMPESAPILKSI